LEDIMADDCCYHEPDALRASWSIQEAASARGFDWPDIHGVFAKVREELEEIEQAWRHHDRAQARRELGDLLFATVNLARFLETEPSAELHSANRRFYVRFERLKEELALEGRELEQCTLAELDVVWERVKRAMKDAQENEA